MSPQRNDCIAPFSYNIYANIWPRPVYEYNIEDIVWSFDLCIERCKIADAGVANKLFDVKC